MNIERKFIDLKDLKLNDEGPGYIEGYRSVYGVIDEGGDIVVKGAFKNTLAEYLSTGFTAHSHDWSFAEAVGFPVESYEDDHGWFVRSQFHSTPDAQAIRTKAQERMKAGKQVGFSFGYAPKEFTHIEAKDYESELPKYVKSDALAAMMKKAQNFTRVRILKSVDAIEDSIVTAPMNKRAAATDVKSQELHVVVHAEPTKVNEANKDVDPPAGQTFEDHSQSVLAAVSELAERAKSIAEIRKKEGRAISTSRRTRLSELLAGLTAVSADIEALLAETEPPPKEKEIDLDDLKLKSLRAQSLAVRALA